LNIIYLHGFASSPRSRKAQFFAERFRALEIPVRILDLAEGCFERLTVSRQLDFIEEQAAGEPVTLIGSSLGGYLAALYASRHANAEKLVLLAPAFGFHELWTASMGPEQLAQWRENGSLPVFHYGEGREIPLGYQFVSDAARFEGFPQVAQPVLIFHGDKDPVVPVAQSIEFVERNPQVKLVRFPQSGHELTDVLPQMWSATESFLLAGGTAI
jgi:uncharacterized protein